PDPAADGEQVREPALALAERRSVADRLQEPDRLAEALLRLRDVPALPCDPGAHVQGPRDRPDGAGLREEPLGLGKRLLGLLELALEEIDLRPPQVDPAARVDRTALLGEVASMRQLGARRLDVEPCRVRVRPREDGHTFEILPARGPRQLELFDDVALRVGEVADPVRGVPRHTERIEAGGRAVVDARQPLP